MDGVAYGEGSRGVAPRIVPAEPDDRLVPVPVRVIAGPLSDGASVQAQHWMPLRALLPTRQIVMHLPSAD